MGQSNQFPQGFTNVLNQTLSMSWGNFIWCLITCFSSLMTAQMDILIKTKSFDYNNAAKEIQKLLPQENEKWTKNNNKYNKNNLWVTRICIAGNQSLFDYYTNQERKPSLRMLQIAVLWVLSDWDICPKKIIF